MANETKAALLRSKSASELADELVELRKEEFKMRMQRGTGQLANTARFKQIRREAARIKTVLNETKKSKASA